ncbi:Hypothetical protein CINCED_3A022137 [Cinara cedri]|uniref:Uncharacterized protein n=1 Tax=Cinara cedri TaxID=506608 RepID=A0A5E4N0N5_9HEMI|nr:Hypothetical protein CINCED_3A022137 [Cinara cedri]
MYFIRNEDDEKSDDEQNSNLERSIDVDDDDIKLKPNDIFNGKNNSEKRVYGRARANLCYSSFYIFCEDFRKQLDYVYAHESEFYRKSM